MKTNTKNLILEQVTNYLTDKSHLPSSPKIIEALLETEKQARKETSKSSLKELVGTWRLCLITGTKKSREKAGIILGKGKFLPSLFKIYLTYTATDESNFAEGKVTNTVDLGILNLSLTGPIKFLSKKNILAFDFIRMNLKLLGFTLYDGYIRDGETREKSFHTDKINKQAFFVYFYITENVIAARGRGGGLAIWSRLS